MRANETINGSSTKYFYTGASGDINQTGWDNCGNGTVTLMFYANNTMGNTESAEISVFKDCIAPKITVMSPLESSSHVTAPIFDISLTDAQLDSAWYRFYYSTWSDPYPIIGSTGTINQTLWNSLSIGSYIIRFYANDTFGNLNYVDVNIEKKKQGDQNGGPSPGGIPGFDLIFITSIISLAVIYRRYNFKNKI